MSDSHVRRLAAEAIEPDSIISADKGGFQTLPRLMDRTDPSCSLPPIPVLVFGTQGDFRVCTGELERVRDRAWNVAAKILTQ